MRLAPALGLGFTVRTGRPDPLGVANILLDADVALLDAAWIERARRWLAPAHMRCLIAVAPEDDCAARAAALERGAADCVDPSVSPRELAARLNGLLKRRAGSAPGPDGASMRGVWSWDDRGHRLRCPNGTVVELSPNERRMLLTFLHRPQRVLTRDFLAQALGEARRIGDVRSVDVAVSRLRHKLSVQDPSARGVITTTRQEGYLFSASVAPLSPGVLGFQSGTPLRI